MLVGTLGTHFIIISNKVNIGRHIWMSADDDSKQRKYSYRHSWISVDDNKIHRKCL